jgi:cytochrome P450
MAVEESELSGVDYDPFTTETMADPYPDLERLLERCPVHHHAPSGLYTVTRWDDVSDMAMEPRVYSSALGVGPEDVIPELRVMVQADEPAHGVQRRVVSKYYAPRRLEAFYPRLIEICHELIDEFADRGWCEFVDEFAYAYPIRIVSELLGWHPTKEQVRDLKDWQMDVLRMLAGQEDAVATGYVAFGNFTNYVFGYVEARKAEIARGDDVPDDPITALLTAEIDGRPFTDMEILGIVQQLLNHETTASMFLHGLYLLLTHPEELDKLRANPDLIDSAVEEILRFRAPVTGLCRTTTTGVEVQGVAIPEGSKVRLMFAAANHDPSHWDEPSRFRIDRDLNEVRRHLTFGLGIHACLGAQVARMEARTGFLALLDRLPNLRFDPEHPAELEDQFWIVNSWRTMRLCWDLPARPGR